MNAMVKIANRKRVEENVDEITKCAPYKVAKLTRSAWQKSNLVKICHGFV